MEEDELGGKARWVGRSMIDCIDRNGDGNRDGSQRSLILRLTRVMQVSSGHCFAVNADILPPSVQSSPIILELYVVSDFTRGRVAGGAWYNRSISCNRRDNKAPVMREQMYDLDAMCACDSEV